MKSIFMRCSVCWCFCPHHHRSHRRRHRRRFGALFVLLSFIRTFFSSFFCYSLYLADWVAGCWLVAGALAFVYCCCYICTLFQFRSLRLVVMLNLRTSDTGIAEVELLSVLVDWCARVAFICWFRTNMTTNIYIYICESSVATHGKNGLALLCASSCFQLHTDRSTSIILTHSNAIFRLHLWLNRTGAYCFVSLLQCDIVFVQCSLHASRMHGAAKTRKIKQYKTEENVDEQTSERVSERANEQEGKKWMTWKF